MTELGKIVYLMLVLSNANVDRKTFGAETPNAGGAELKYEQPKFLTGGIYDRNGKQLLYKFKRVAQRAGQKLDVQREYTYPDGRLAARENVVYQGDDLVSYELDETQIGASGRARIERSATNTAKGSVQFEYKPQAETKARTEALQENTLIADMMPPFLVEHWDALMHGDKLKCRYIVVPRKETVGFTFVKESESTLEGQRTVRIKMEASSLIIRALVDPLFFTMEHASPHRVLQYSGRTTPKLRVGSKWKDLDAVTVFDWGAAQFK